MSDDRDELVKIAIRLWERVEESKAKTANLERELRLVEEKIATKPKGVEPDA